MFRICLPTAQEKSQFDVFKETFERKAARERELEAERKKKREVQALRYQTKANTFVVQCFNV